MVYFFRSSTGTLIYMGKDKYENEELIKYGWPEDVWFHVDDLSSAHVYLRLRGGKKLDDIDPVDLEECCQLVKHNSISGSKKSSVDVIYTPWSNLRKEVNMEVGAVSFHNRKNVRKCTVEKRDKAIIKALEKTKEWKEIDLKAAREKRDEEEMKHHRRRKQEEKKKAKEEEVAKKKKKDLESYKDLFDDDDPFGGDDFGGGGGGGKPKPTSDVTAAQEYEDSFM